MINEVNIYFMCSVNKLISIIHPSAKNHTRVFVPERGVTRIHHIVCLPRPMEGKGVTPNFSYLSNYLFHHRRLKSLKHLIVFLNMMLVL